MENKKYQIFVSSTYKDLIEAREKVIETVLSLYHFPVGMEMFSADDSEQWDIIKDAIDVSDYYVVIIGHRYGSMTSDGLGYTEKEYDYAKAKGVPIIAFIRNRNISTMPDEREISPEANEKLVAFIDKASANKMCDYWGTIEELSAKVAIALPKNFSRKPQIGWVRGNTAVSKEISEELVNLSQENRQLRDRISELEAAINQGTPIIEVLLNSSSHLNMDTPLKVPEMIEELPAPLSIDDIPEHLKDYVSESDINNYNNKIPSKETIDEFNNKKKLYWSSQNTTPLKVSVINNGFCKANDINIVIKFPNNVFVLSIDNIESITDPSSPLPLSPIKRAENKIQAEKELQEKKKKGLFSLDNLGVDLIRGTMIARPHFNDRLPRSLANLNSTRWIDVKENTVKIKIQSLLHTRQYNFDEDIVLIPFKEGDSFAEVSIICEEFRKEEVMQLEINVHNVDI